MTTTLDRIMEHGLGDYSLVGIQWIAGGSDLLLVFETPSRELVHLTAGWATEVRVDLDFGDYSGKPLVFRSSVDESDGGKGYLLKVEFGAAPEGSLSLRCNELIVEQIGRTG